MVSAPQLKVLIHQVPAWSLYNKQVPTEEGPSCSGNTSSVVSTQEDNTPVIGFGASFSKTPSSARVKRKVAETKKSTDFFNDMPEFKRLKQSSSIDEFSFSKANTPGYKNGQMFRTSAESQRNEVSRDQNDIQSCNVTDAMEESSGSESMFTSKRAVSNIFSASQFKTPSVPSHKGKANVDSGIFTFDDFAGNSLLSVLSAPKVDPKTSDRKKMSQSEKQELDVTLPSFSLFEGPEENPPVIGKYSGSPYSLQKASLISYQSKEKHSHSPKAQTQNTTDLWLADKNRPVVSRPRLLKRPTPDILDESRDLFCDEPSILPLPISCKADPTKNRSLTETPINTTTSASSQHISDYVSKVIDKFQSPIEETVQQCDLQSSQQSSPTITPFQSRVNETIVSPRQLAEFTDSVTQTEENADRYSGTVNLKCALYITSDHSYCKNNAFFRMVLSSVTSLSFITDKGKVECGTQTTADGFVGNTLVVEKSDSQNSKSPPPKEDTLKLNDIIHFGDSDFVNELEVVESTPRDSQGYKGSGTQNCLNFSMLSNNPTEQSFQNLKVHEVENSERDVDNNLMLPCSGQSIEETKETNCPENNERMSPHKDKQIKAEQPKKKTIIWPDEEMFFIKLPNYTQQKLVDEKEPPLGEDLDISLNDHEKDRLPNKFDGLNSKDLVLRIKNNIPTKPDSPARKFVPFFTSQKSKPQSDKLIGTVDDPTHISPVANTENHTCSSETSNGIVNDFVQSSPVSTSQKHTESFNGPSLPTGGTKRSPFLIVGQKAGLLRDNHFGESILQVDGSFSCQKSFEYSQVTTLTHSNDADENETKVAIESPRNRSDDLDITSSNYEDSSEDSFDSLTIATSGALTETLENSGCADNTDCQENTKTSQGIEHTIDNKSRKTIESLNTTELFKNTSVVADRESVYTTQPMIENELIGCIETCGDNGPGSHSAEENVTQSTNISEIESFVSNKSAVKKGLSEKRIPVKSFSQPVRNSCYVQQRTLPSFSQPIILAEE